VRMRSIRAETGTARIPSKVMQFVAGVRHLHASDDFSVPRGRRIHIDHADGIRPPPICRIQQGDIREFFGGGLTRQLRRGIKCRIRSPQLHSVSPLRFPRASPEGKSPLTETGNGLRKLFFALRVCRATNLRERPAQPNCGQPDNNTMNSGAAAPCHEGYSPQGEASILPAINSRFRAFVLRVPKGELWSGQAR